MQKEIGWLLQEKYGGKITPAAKRDIKKLKSGVPVDYLIGFVEFGVPPGSCKIDLSKKPLIPRVETEYWVEKAIEGMKSRKSFDFAQDKINNRLFILDMFAGSGCIGISITCLPAGRCDILKNAYITFVDNDEACIKQIKINAQLNKISKRRYRIIKSDIFENVQGKFDYIFANPPYIPTKRTHKIQTSVLKYEPKTALFGGADGLFYIRKFLAQAPNFLNPGGKIYMEFDSFQKPKIGKLIKKYGYDGCEFNKDQYGKWRYVVISQ